MPKFESLGERQKFFEKNFGNGPYLIPGLPVLARVDGRHFHSFCQGLERPYHIGLSESMVWTMEFLVKETGALAGYTQSDEITLLWLSEGQSQIFFDGRVQKIVSGLSSLATYFFNEDKIETIPEKRDTPAFFDARVWNVPSKEEAVNNFIWRQRDATKNAISMAARAHFSHKSLHGLNGKQMQELLWQNANVNFNNYPAFFKRGTFCRVIKVQRAFRPHEIEKLPEKHEARKNPSLMIERSEIERVDLWLDKIENKVGVLFRGEAPEESNG